MLDKIDHISEFLCLVIATLLWLKHRSSFFMAFTIYLVFITINELLAHYFISNNNQGIYLLNALAFVVFNGYIFNKLSHASKLLKFIKYATVLYVIFWLLWLSYFGSNATTLQVILTVGLNIVNITALTFLYSYLYDVFINNRTTNKGDVWYASGVIVFCSGLSVCFSLLQYFAKHQIKFIGLPIHNTLPKLFCVVLYTCTIIALLLWRPKAAN